MPLTPEQAESILDGVSLGKSLRSCLEAVSCSTCTFYNELDASDGKLKERYARARQMQAEAHAGKIADLADDVLGGKYEANAARVALDALKWTASKLHPAIYGDKVQAEVTGSLNMTVSWLPPAK